MADSASPAQPARVFKDGTIEPTPDPQSGLSIPKLPAESIQLSNADDPTAGDFGYKDYFVGVQYIPPARSEPVTQTQVSSDDSGATETVSADATNVESSPGAPNAPESTSELAACDEPLPDGAGVTYFLKPSRGSEITDLLELQTNQAFAPCWRPVTVLDFQFEDNFRNTEQVKAYPFVQVYRYGTTDNAPVYLRVPAYLHSCNSQNQGVPAPAQNPDLPQFNVSEAMVNYLAYVTRQMVPTSYCREDVSVNPIPNIEDPLYVMHTPWSYTQYAQIRKALQWALEYLEYKERSLRLIHGDRAKRRQLFDEIEKFAVSNPVDRAELEKLAIALDKDEIKMQLDFLDQVYPEPTTLGTLWQHSWPAIPILFAILGFSPITNQVIGDWWRNWRSPNPPPPSGTTPSGSAGGPSGGARASAEPMPQAELPASGPDSDKAPAEGDSRETRGNSGPTKGAVVDGVQKTLSQMLDPSEVAPTSTSQVPADFSGYWMPTPSLAKPGFQNQSGSDLGAAEPLPPWSTTYPILQFPDDWNNIPDDLSAIGAVGLWALPQLPTLSSSTWLPSFDFGMTSTGYSMPIPETPSAYLRAAPGVESAPTSAWGSMRAGYGRFVESPGFGLKLSAAYAALTVVKEPVYVWFDVDQENQDFFDTALLGGAVVSFAFAPLLAVSVTPGAIAFEEFGNDLATEALKPDGIADQLDLSADSRKIIKNTTPKAGAATAVVTGLAVGVVPAAVGGSALLASHDKSEATWRELDQAFAFYKTYQDFKANASTEEIALMDELGRDLLKNLVGVTLDSLTPQAPTPEQLRACLAKLKSQKYKALVQKAAPYLLAEYVVRCDEYHLREQTWVERKGLDYVAGATNTVMDAAVGLYNWAAEDDETAWHIQTEPERRAANRASLLKDWRAISDYLNGIIQEQQKSSPQQKTQPSAGPLDT